MLSLYFNNIKIPDWIKIRDIQEDILSLNNSKKKITIDFYFKRNKLISLDEKTELINWIKGNNFEESKLILPTRSNRFYMAKCTNLSTISGSIRKGEGTIEFEISKEFDINKNSVRFSSSTTINYLGTVEVYPTVTFRVRSTCSKIKLSINNTFIELNGSFNAGNTIVFNQETFEIKLNNSTNMQILHLNSKRYKLRKGNNTYTLNAGSCEVELSWNNKYE